MKIRILLFSLILLFTGLSAAHTQEQWLSIKAIEIIPIIKESADKRRHVVAHELFFYTDNNILDLISELTIR